MQTALAVAAGLSVVTGIAHSVLGEVLIFGRLRRGSLVPSDAAGPLGSRQVRILWATWHLASVFGWAFAAVLARLAIDPDAPVKSLVITATIAAYGTGSLLVLVGTRGRHPGWIALAVIAALTWVGTTP